MTTKKAPKSSGKTKMPPMKTYNQTFRDPAVDKFGLETPKNAGNGDNRQPIKRAPEETIT